MKKWVKRLVVCVVAAVLVVAVVGVAAYFYGVRGTPEWVRRPFASQAEQAAAANSLDQKILETLSVVREMDAVAANGAERPGKSDKRPAATQPYSKLEVSFTEDELNASFQKWDKLYGWTDRYREHVQEPSIVLHDGRIIVAGQSEELGTVVSLHFEPKLDARGQLDLRLARLLAGKLPLPQSFFEKYRTAARSRLTGVLPTLQREAELNPDGSANTEAMSAAMAKLFLNVLANEPAEPVLFLPVANKRSVPVRLTNVNIENKTLTLTVKPLNGSERVALLERIRERYHNETARAKAPNDVKRSLPTGS